MNENGLDAIVRIHDVERLPELERSIMSLIGQSYRPLAIYVVTQRFSQSDTDLLQKVLDTFARLGTGAGFQLLNYNEPEPRDARSCLINLGYAHLRGRYVYLLDYDDITTPNGCATLIKELAETGAAICFGKVMGSQLAVDGPIIMTRTRQDLYRGRGLIDLFRANFCPIHSFVVDRSRLRAEALWFDPSRSRDEDYDFLIRTCAAYPSSFRKKEYVVGFYGLKDDGSNTVMAPGAETDARWAEWRRSAELTAERRATTLVSPRVQRQLGFAPDATLTVARLLQVTSDM